MKILITGASGFVGSSLTELLKQQGHQLRLVMRGHKPSAVSDRVIANIDTFNKWHKYLADIDIVIHLAARVHHMDEQGDVNHHYQRTNVDATVRLAEAAAQSGVKRFIFLSSIKVNGEETRHGENFSAQDAPAPHGAYGKSKLQAELALKKISDQTDMALVIIRPPLIYGPQVKANFLRLVELAQAATPLPFAGINNYRDMVSVDNLCDLIAHCVQSPQAAGGTFLVSDGKAYSTADIVKAVRSISGRPHRLFYCPPGLITIALTLVGKKAMADRLFGSLQIDMSATVEALDWSPSYTLEQTLKKMLT